MTDHETKKIELIRNIYVALNKESSIRESCFLPITLDLCGIKCKQFTLGMYVLLDFSKNPLMSGEGEVTPTDILAFLWIVSEDYKPANKEAFDEFVKKHCDTLDFVKAIKEISDYLEATFLDVNSSGGGESNGKHKKQYYSWISVYIDLLASQYGWTRHYIMELPLTEIMQYSRLIEERLSGENKPPFINKFSDLAQKNLNDYLAEYAKETNQKLVITEEK